jgi:hypothetical protein
VSIAVVVCAGAVAAIALAGCGGNGVRTQGGPASGTPTALTSTSATPVATTPAPQAGAAAIAQVGVYEHMLDQLAINKHLSLNRLYRVSTQPDVNQQIGYLNHFRAAGERQTGHVQLSATHVVHVDLTNHPGSAHPVYPSVVVATCVKVSGVKTFNGRGSSTTAKSRKPYFKTRLTLINVKYPAPDQWLVKSVTDTEVRTCSA